MHGFGQAWKALTMLSDKLNASAFSISSSTTCLRTDRAYSRSIHFTGEHVLNIGYEPRKTTSTPPTLQ